MKTNFYLGLNPSGFHKIAVYEWGDMSASGVPVICVHGLLRNGRDFDYLAEKLSASRRVYCPDMPGRGLSDDLLNPLDYTFAQYMADMAALIAKTGAGQVDWIGSSMGGLIGMMLAAQPQSPIRRLIINDVGPVVPKSELNRIGDYLIGNYPHFTSIDEVEERIRKVYAQFGALTDAQWRGLAEHNVRKAPEGDLVLAYDFGLAKAFQAAGTDIDYWSVYDNIRCPTLLVRGALSDLLPAAVAEEMTRRGPKPKLTVIENVGHVPMFMNDDQVKIVKDFLEG